MILVTGGAGFIGSNFILDWCRSSDEQVINIDKLTYAGNLMNLSSLEDSPQHEFFNVDIGNSKQVSKIPSNQLFQIPFVHRPNLLAKTFALVTTNYYKVYHETHLYIPGI